MDSDETTICMSIPEEQHEYFDPHHPVWKKIEGPDDVNFPPQLPERHGRIMPFSETH